MPATRPIAICAAVCSAAFVLTTAHAQVAPAASTASQPPQAASLSGSASDDCAAQRKLYLESQACFQRYRVANGAVRPEGYKACRNVVDPAPRCGPNLPTQ